MRRNLKRLVAVAVAATMVVPTTAWADGEFCNTYHQVESNATGGDYVGGMLVYETMGTVTRQGGSTTTTVTTTTTGSVGVSSTTAGGTVTVAVTTTSPGATVTAQEPFGYYAMNDGSVYRINCATGEADLIAPAPKKK